jgi:long-chain acyl-CoA synthetase
LDEVRALALGLRGLGVAAGDRIAIVGANRPRLYWSFTAAQSIGAIPVPVYADSVADELAHVLNDAGARLAVVQDQEQVDKILANQAAIPGLTDLVYDEGRGLRSYDKSHLHDFAGVQEEGRRIMAAYAGAAGRWEDAVKAASGEDVSVILYTSGTTGRSKGVMISAVGAVSAAVDTVAFDRLTERDSVLAYLPLAWVSDHYLNYAQGYVAGFCTRSSMPMTAN